mgnify:CR=1 FL=1
MELKSVIITDDGKIFDTKQEALDYMRKPLKAAAFNKLNGDNKELTEWLIENEEHITSVFESTKVRRVAKAEKKALEKAVESIVASGDKAFKFVIDNSQAVIDSFRWPAVKRGTEEEQTATIRQGFLALSDNNVDLADWLIANKAEVLESYEAGIVKKAVPQTTRDALAKYQAEKKAAKEAAKETAAA